MSKKQKPTAFGSDSTAPAGNAFAKLVALKGTLPEGSATIAKESNTEPRTSGKIVISRERKGRGGKTVTLIRGLPLDGDALEQLARELRQSLGTGGTIEDGAIVLNGDQSLRAAECLVERNMGKVVVA
jgi:translation initiation factor 1